MSFGNEIEPYDSCDVMLLKQKTPMCYFSLTSFILITEAVRSFVRSVIISFSAEERNYLEVRISI